MFTASLARLAIPTDSDLPSQLAIPGTTDKLAARIVEETSVVNFMFVMAMLSERGFPKLDNGLIHVISFHGESYFPALCRPGPLPKAALFPSLLYADRVRTYIYRGNLYYNRGPSDD